MPSSQPLPARRLLPSSHCRRLAAAFICRSPTCRKPQSIVVEFEHAHSVLLCLSSCVRSPDRTLALRMDSQVQQQSAIYPILWGCM